MTTPMPMRAMKVRLRSLVRMGKSNKATLIATIALRTYPVKTDKCQLGRGGSVTELKLTKVDSIGSPTRISMS